MKKVLNDMTRWKRRRPAIALLITLFFVISVTAAVGVSIIQLRLSAQQVREGKCLIQSSMILDDLLKLLKTTPLLDQVKDAQSMDYFLQNASIIPVALENLNVRINIDSAMGRFNINTLSYFKPFQEALSAYMVQYDISDTEYFQDLLIDCMSGRKSEYRTDIFDAMPWLYRERIVSMTHLEQIIDHYVLSRHDNNIRKIPWEKLVRFAPSDDRKIDANYITPQLWQLLLPEITESIAIDLASNEFVYERDEDLSLADEEMMQLKPFELSYYLPRTLIEVDVKRNDQNVHVAFEYDLKLKKGGNFDYGL